MICKNVYEIIDESNLCVHKTVQQSDNWYLENSFYTQSDETQDQIFCKIIAVWLKC